MDCVGALVLACELAFVCECVSGPPVKRIYILHEIGIWNRWEVIQIPSIYFNLCRPYPLIPVHVGFVVDQWLLFRFYLEYIGFPLSLLFHQCSIPIIIPLPSMLYVLDADGFAESTTKNCSNNRKLLWWRQLISHVQCTRDLWDSKVKNDCVKFHAFLEYAGASRYVRLIPGKKSVFWIV